MAYTDPEYIFGGSVANYYVAREGINLLDKLQPLTDWLDARWEHNLDPYSKSSDGPILTECRARDRRGKKLQGINMASQDYLSLASHPEIKKAGKEAIENFGVHSAGSPTLMGNTAASVELEKRLADFLHIENCTVFATGWAAGYGAIKTLVQEKDHIVIDRLAHASLVEGARNATNNLHVFKHLNLSSLEKRLQRIRKVTPESGILIVTESLFSMDSDSPDIELHQKLAKKYNATLMLDIAHDLGCMGHTGRGFLEIQNMLGKVDVIMGSFSKTFASNGGFVASNHPALKLALRCTCGPLVFSNALSPVQASIALKALDIVESPEGNERRNKMLFNANYLRSKLSEYGYELIGDPSAIVPVVHGEMTRSRLITKFTLERGGLVNLIEYPAVAKNGARHRLQVMADHTTDQIDRFVEILNSAAKDADQIVEQIVHSESNVA